MNKFLILLFFIIILLLIYRKIDKYVFMIVLSASLVLYYKDTTKEQFQDFNRGNSVLTFHEKINDMHDLGLNKSSYEEGYNVKLSVEGDRLIEESLDETTTSPPEAKTPLKYGQTILLQSNAKEHLYLTGNREGSNINISTTSPGGAIGSGEGNEGVFTTNEDIQLLQWVVYPINKYKMGSIVMFGDKVHLLCKHPTKTKYLIGNQSLRALEYNISETNCGVYTLSVNKIPDGYSEDKWQIKYDFNDNMVGTPVYLDSHVLLSINDKYLSGGRKFGYINNETNQQVYTVGVEDGKYENYWIVKNKKEPRKPINRVVQISEIIRRYRYLNTDITYNGVTSGNILQDNNKIINFVFPSGFELQNNPYIIDLFNNKYINHMTINPDFLKDVDKLRFFIKVAKNDGSFYDLPLLESDYLYNWRKKGTEVFLKNENNGTFYKFDINNMQSLASSSKISLGEEADYKFKLNLHNDYVYFTKKIIRKSIENYVLISENAGQSFIEFNGHDVPKKGLFKYHDKKLINMDNDELFPSFSVIITKDKDSSNTIKPLKINIDNEIRYIKIYPLNQATNQEGFKVSLLTKNIDADADPDEHKVEFKQRETTSILVNTNDDAELEILSNNINISAKTSSGEKRYIEYELSSERYIHGLKFNNYSHNQLDIFTLKKIKLFTSRSNGIYKYKGEFEVKDGTEIPIKTKCKFVKIILEKTTNFNDNDKVKFNLELF